MFKQLKQFNWKNVSSCLIVALLLIAGSSFLTNKYWPARILSTQVFIPVPEIKETVKFKKIIVPGPERIVTIEKEKVAQELGLQTDLVDPGAQVTATAEIPPSKAGTEIVSVMTTDTDGVATNTLIAKEKELPLLGLLSAWEVGVRYGWDTKAGTSQYLAGDVHARWQFLRVGPVTVGAYAEANTLPGARAMIELAW